MQLCGQLVLFVVKVEQTWTNISVILDKHVHKVRILLITNSHTIIVVKLFSSCSAAHKCFPDHQ
jgi:hypothetical protein